MLKELKTAKQIFYRHYYKYPNAINITESALRELKIELGSSFSAARINGCIVFINNELKEPFEFVSLAELEPDD